MAIGDGSRVQLGFLKEVTWGTTPVSALTALRYTKESLGRRIENVRSDEVRADRMVSDIIRVGANAAGQVNFELSHNSYQTFLEAALGGTFGALSTVTAANIAAVASGNHFTAASGLPVFSPGQWVRVSGFVNASNNGYFEVVTSSATDLVVQNGAAALVNESVGPSVTIGSTALTNGTVKASYTLEKYFSDLTLYWAFKGMRLNSLEIDIQSRAKIVGTLDFMGMGGAVTNATAGSGAYAAAPTTSIMNASNNVGRITENGAALPAGVYVKGAKIKYSNNLRPIEAIGSLDAVEIGYGRFTVTGELSVYFANELLFNRYLNGVDSGLVILANTPSPENDAYAFALPAIEFTNGDLVGQGNDNDVLAVLEFEAKMHSSQGIMARIDSFT